MTSDSVVELTVCRYRQVGRTSLDTEDLMLKSSGVGSRIDGSPSLAQEVVA